MELAQAAGLLVIEDASQAHGARYRGRRVGTIGDAGTFSFYPAKNLGAWGDGGAVVTAREELADRVRLLRSHGESPRYRHRVVGTTGRLDAIQAAVLRSSSHVWMSATRPGGWRPAGCARRSSTPTRSSLPRRWRPTATTSTTSSSSARHGGTLSETSWPGRASRPVSTTRYPSTARKPTRPLREGYDAAPRATRLADEILSLPMFPSLTGGADRADRRCPATVLAAHPRLGNRPVGLTAVDNHVHPRLQGRKERSPAASHVVDLSIARRADRRHQHDRAALLSCCSPASRFGWRAGARRSSASDGSDATSSPSPSTSSGP